MSLPHDFTYRLTNFPTPDLAALRPFYERLPLDPYIQGRFRQRRFSHFIGPAHALRRLEHMYFLQSKAVNQLAGGIRREFAELEDGLLAEPAFQAMVAAFIAGMGIDPTVREIGVHQIRISCSPEHSGSPAPEGIHQDGFDYIGMFCVERHQIIGATTRIYPGKDQPPIFSRDLQAGEAVLANDRQVYHFAETVRPSGDQPGHWDLLVITS
jgi:hypothetical protein